MINCGHNQINGKCSLSKVLVQQKTNMKINYPNASGKCGLESEMTTVVEWACVRACVCACTCIHVSGTWSILWHHDHKQTCDNVKGTHRGADGVIWITQTIRYNPNPNMPSTNTAPVLGPGHLLHYGLYWWGFSVCNIFLDGFVFLRCGFTI